MIFGIGSPHKNTRDGVDDHVKQQRRAETVVFLAGSAEYIAWPQILQEAHKQGLRRIHTDVAQNMDTGEDTNGDQIGQDGMFPGKPREQPAPEEAFFRQGGSHNDGKAHEQGPAWSRCFGH